MGVVASEWQRSADLLEHYLQGISAAAPVTRFDVSNLPSKIAAEVKNFNVETTWILRQPVVSIAPSV